ncbi:OmdA domain containing protein [Streptomyces nanshensis]|nr:OmdA domain containing protein [Streptomyces nanshensis]
MDSSDDLEVIRCVGEAEFEAWIAAHHAEQRGVWVKMAKKNSGVASVTDDQALDVVLCYGWINGQRKRYDDTYYLQKFTPRRRGSTWSQVNIRKVEALVAAGRMKEPGLAEVAAARADGRWDAAYPSQKEAVVPDDLAAALERSAPARSFFDRLGKSDRYIVILRLMTAKNDVSRAERLRRMIASMESGRKVT